MYQHKINFTERFKNRLPLRIHITFILLATGLSGILIHAYYPEVTRISELIR